MSDADLDAYRARARSWLEANLEPVGSPRPRATDVDPGFLAEERRRQRELCSAGYAGIAWPSTYGGQGLSSRHERVFNEEAEGFRTPDFGVLGQTTFGICVPTMLAHGSPELLARHVPHVVAGNSLWVQLFSEPDAGSDLAGVRTRATRSGDRWTVSGSKIWSSGAYFADHGLCLARTSWDVPKHRGLTWFAVPMDAPGVTIRRLRQITGASEFCQVFLDGVELTDADVVGEVDAGWSVARTMLATERGGGSRGAADAAHPADALAPDLVALADGVGRRDDPQVRDLVARAHVADVVMAELRSRVIALSRAGVADPGSLAAYVKLAHGTVTPERARIGLQIAGAAALSWPEGSAAEAATAHAFLAGRSQSIAGGTNEMMRNVIGERLLGLPREHSVDTDVPFAEVIRRTGATPAPGQGPSGECAR
ncbi:acyl-CoA dehydrogenase [Pseudonocardia sulfidoxydans NBRC 16205]|uniref:Acyl-CoA dehydrogenase n=1 Tax=Pseudonocardia sulfidoxydans NBRC 16205 TaxID=1223511 RepID=A0A511D8U3_9PSEU|nr:acyl-CoA dehydrogenase family protein [Pseudonocardia sulfidoxydans]GEL21220.1 acyl-CoA dehydrogenase [Pseudonocardia sulfidoxydans NBRC 16205]